MKTNNSVVTRSPKRKLYPAALPSRKRQALAPLDSLPVDALKHRMCLRPRSRSVSPTESGVKKRKKKPYPPPFIIRPDSPVDASSSERMILRPKQKSPPQPSPTQNQEERPEKIPAPVDARASEIPPPPTEKQEERRELEHGITPEGRAIANLLGEWMKLRRERLKRLTREHVMPMEDFTSMEANLCRYIFMKREWELGDTIPDNKKDLKERLDIARRTKGYGVTSRVGGVDGESFFPLMSDLGEGGDPVLKRRVNTMIKKALLQVNKREMELQGKQRYKSAGVVNLVRISRYYLLTLRICLDNETHPPVEPRTVEALFFKHPASQVPVELKEWRMKMGSELLFRSENGLLKKAKELILSLFAEESQRSSTITPAPGFLPAPPFFLLSSARSTEIEASPGRFSSEFLLFSLLLHPTAVEVPSFILLEYHIQRLCLDSPLHVRRLSLAASSKGVKCPYTIVQVGLFQFLKSIGEVL